MGKTIQNNKIKVLYVDDEDAWRIVFQRNMKGVFDVISARNAEEGWELLRKHSSEIGVIISDQRMPGRPGIELLKQAKAYYPKILRIITTGFSDSSIAVHATNQGAVYHYISKPWNADDLVAIVKRAMDFYMLRRERDNLLERKLSTIQRKNLESKFQCLLVFGMTIEERMNRPIEALKSYLDSIMRDPGEIHDFKSVYKRSQGELGNLLLNLNLVKQLNTLHQRFGSDAISMDESVSLQKILLNLRDNCSQVIYSARNSRGSGSGGLTVAEQFIADQFLELVMGWIAQNPDEKLLEISEVDSVCEAVGTRFLVRICNYSDPSPLLPIVEDPIFDGINLEEKQELTWLMFLFCIYHFGGEVEPIHLSNERMVFNISTFDFDRKSNLSPDGLTADLVRKFESWNYMDFENVLEEDSADQEVG